MKPAIGPRQEYFALYSQLLKGHNLIRQKGWNPQQLRAFFPHDRAFWEPFLTGRDTTPLPENHDQIWSRMGQLLDQWEEPAEEKILRRRWLLLGDYCVEAAKRECDQQSLEFFLREIEVPSTLTLPAGPKTEMLKSYSPLEAQVFLAQEMLELYPQHDTHVRLDAHSLARASTGKNYIRLRDEGAYEHSELKALTAHEIWVHLGSNLQGTLQTEFPWLAQWHPGVTAFQEGLAIIAEIVSGHWSEERRLEVTLRHQAGMWALAGHDAGWVHRSLKENGIGHVAALRIVLRVFRGCSMEGGMAFGKELLYGAGFMHWQSLKHNISDQDMCLALSGKMDFHEWHWLRAESSRVILAQPPRALVEWSEHAAWGKKKIA